MRVILAAFFAIPGTLLGFGIFYLIGMWWLFPPIFAACLFYAWKTKRPARTGDVVVGCDCQEWWAQTRTFEDAQERLRLHIEHDCRLYSVHRWMEQRPRTAESVETEPFIVQDHATAGSDDGLGRFGKITDLDEY